jgi:hypothetical protein
MKYDKMYLNYAYTDFLGIILTTYCKLYYNFFGLSTTNNADGNTGRAMKNKKLSCERYASKC